MSTRMIRTAALAFIGAIVASAGTAYADFFQSNGSAAWDSYASAWEQRATEDDTWASATRRPQNGDNVTIRNGHTVTVATNNEEVTILVISSGGTLVINAAKDLSLAGASPSAVVVGTFTVSGTFKLSSASGNAPYMEVQSARTIPAAGGDVLGDVAAASTPEIRINAVTLTNGGMIHGVMTIKGISNGVFANNGVVDADAAGVLALHSTLNSISDNLGSSCSSYRWRVSNSGTLQFDKAATGLAGDFQVGPGALNVNANVTSSGLFKFLTGGSVVPSSASFSITGSGGTGTGNRYCAGSNCTSAAFPYTSPVSCP